MLGRDVVAAAGRAGHEVVALARADLDITDAAAVRAAVARRARPTRSSTARPGPTSTAPRPHEAHATARQRRRRRARRRRGRRGRRAPRPRLDRLRLRRHARPSRTPRTRRPARIGAYGRSKLAGEHAVAAAAPAARDRAHAPGCSARTARTSSTRCCGSAPSATSSPSSTTRSAARPTPATSRPRSSTIAEQRPHRRPARRRRRPAARGSTSPRATFEAAGARRARVAAAARTAEFGRARRRAPRTPCSAPTRADAPVLPPWRDGLHAYLDRVGGAAHEAARLRRRRLHRLELRPPARRASTATRSSCSTSSPTPAARENLAGRSTRRLRLRARRDRGPDAVADAIEGCDAVVNFAAETHVDRSIAEPDAFVTHARARHLRAARGGARARRCATSRSRPTRSTARSRRARSPRSRRSQPSSPYSATKAGADLLVASYRHTFGLEALICRGSNNYGPYQYPEKLIPLMVLNALHGDKLPVYGDGMQVRNWIYVEDFARGIGTVLEHGEPGEVYNVGGPDEAPNLEVVQRIIELHRRRRVADRVRHRPPRPRPPLLARLREGARARLGAAGALRRGPRAHGRPGTATTAGGGSRSAPATTARTTSASTAARSADWSAPSIWARPRWVLGCRRMSH